MTFKLHSHYEPAGDQPKAIDQLCDGLEKGMKGQTLLGVTGSGKTFTMANVIERVQRPTLVIAHNKTLAAQLCSEFRSFFPENAVEYFVSYYDYYQPEAYMPRSDTYIEKEAQVNEEIDRLRHSATKSLLSRRDVIVVASVSCIYGLGSPDEYKDVVLELKVGQDIDRAAFLRQLVGMYYERTTTVVERGKFRALGDVVEVQPASEKKSMYRVTMDGGKVHEIFLLDPLTRKIKDRLQNLWLFPNKHYVVGSDRVENALSRIRHELDERLEELDGQGKVLEHARLKQRTKYDIEMIKNLGYCNGIENYSRHFEGRKAGEPASTLLSYFPDDFLTVIDESHVTVSQVRAMYAGDQARKKTLIDHGFRLPSAADNRPLQFEEFEEQVGQTVYVSATPGNYEGDHSDQVVEQIVRPTGLVDPRIVIRPVTEGVKPGGAKGIDFVEMLGVEIDAEVPALGQVDDLIERVKVVIENKGRSLVTTLTKKMAEDLTQFLVEEGMKVQYLHSGVQTFERIEVLSKLREGVYDIVVGVNLLREGLDLPEVQLVAILDADKEGFLRSETSLVQTIGRAARNADGYVVLYADKMTGSMKRALVETKRRRDIQEAYNEEHGITPTTIVKKVDDIRDMISMPESTDDVLDVELTASVAELDEAIFDKTDEMKKAAANLLFETAARLRDEIELLKKERAGRIEDGGA